MKKHIKNNLGFIMFGCYAVLIVVVALVFGDLGITLLPLITLLIIFLFDPLNNLSWSVRSFIRGSIK